MQLDEGHPAPSVLAVGDPVVAVDDIGLFRRWPRIRRGTPGVVVALSPWGDVEVLFAEQGRELVRDRQLQRAS